MTLSQRIGVVEINTLWLFRYLQLAKKRTKVVSFHRLSGTGMTSLIHLSPLLKCLMTVCPSSLYTRAFKGLISPPSKPPGEIMSFGVSPVNYSVIYFHLCLDVWKKNGVKIPPDNKIRVAETLDP